VAENDLFPHNAGGAKNWGKFIGPFT